jgi:hypothetical protein
MSLRRFFLALLLVVDPTWLDDVRITLVRPDGSQEEQAGGDTLPFAQCAVPDRKINLALDLADRLRLARAEVDRAHSRELEATVAVRCFPEGVRL